jgi:RimJ/RimL family protein N-acetyltransferase
LSQSVKFVPITELSDKHWYQAYLTMFNPKLARHMGVDPLLIANPPSLVQFYQNLMNAHKEGRFMAWGIIREDEYLGHTLLDKTCGEWEIGTVLKDEKLWGSGLGVRATLRALKWAFEEQDIEWVVAFTQGRDPKVPDLLRRGGFRPLFNYHVMHRDVWKQKWGRRSKDGSK